MPLYRYKALNSRGETLGGTMDAGSESEVALRLQEQGHLPVETRLASEAGGVDDWKALFKPRPFSGQRLVQFTQQLATLLNAGQPLDRALTILLDLPDEPEAKRTITEVRDAVRGGSPLSAALERQHGTFSRLYINMVRAGEAGGSLEDTLQRLADYLESARALQGRVVNALIYPAILIVMVCASLLFLLGYVVPQFAAMYESLDAELPVFTKIVLGAGEFVRDWWILLLVVPVLAAYGFWLKLQDARFRARFDGWLLQRRFVGQLVARIETARLARTLGTLLRNGVPLIGALTIGRNVLGNLALSADVDAAATEVKNGVALSTALGRSKRLPRLAIQMIQVGEESGAMDTMLLKTADTFEQQTGQSLDRLLAALVPAITMLLALIVMVVILAVLVPIYDLTSVIG